MSRPQGEISLGEIFVMLEGMKEQFDESVERQNRQNAELATSLVRLAAEMSANNRAMSEKFDRYIGPVSVLEHQVRQHEEMLKTIPETREQVKSMLATLGTYGTDMKDLNRKSAQASLLGGILAIGAGVLTNLWKR